MTVPLDEMGQFMDNRVAYVASQCGLATEVYQAWLKHYETLYALTERPRAHVVASRLSG